MDTSLEIIRTFAEELHGKAQATVQAAPEEQLKAPIMTMLRALGERKGSAGKVDCLAEARVDEEGGNIHPDIACMVEGALCGYIELKKPGLGGDPTRLSGAHNKRQWSRMQNLPNLIYSDGQEWGLYRNGEQIGSLVRFDARPDEKSKAAVTAEKAKALEQLLEDFFRWQPIVPHDSKGLAEYLAPLVRRVRDEVAEALAKPKSAISLLQAEWKEYFDPNVDDKQFADSYAQTMVYALLLARLQGATNLDPIAAAKILNGGKGLLAETLKLLGQEKAQEALQTSFSLLQRSLEAFDSAEFLKGEPDLWLYFYEEFLAAYDSKLRKNYGVYYTPRQVPALQVRLASSLLKSHFKKTSGFADEGVTFIDPAVGTGTYLVEAANYALAKAKQESGDGAVSSWARQLARNMYGFEILVGPYAVAHLRLTQALGQASLTEQRLQIYLADTLASPNDKPPGSLKSLTHEELSKEHEAARQVKDEGEILVCLGNPPYNRQHIEHGDTTTQRKGGWVRFGDTKEDKKQGDPPIFDDFTKPVSKAGSGRHIKNLYNDYVYFWRWALWRMFEQQSGGGIISFITASSYLRGPGFIGMREVMRRTFDELWIIDLGGDNLGARKTENIFDIQTPVAIAIGVRGKKPQPDSPATVYYYKVTADSREGKLQELEQIEDFDDVDWRTVDSDWHTPFVYQNGRPFFQWPLLSDIFPLALNGVQYKRTWPIAETQELLKRRWRKFTNASLAERTEMFRETSDRTVTKVIEKGRDGRPLPGSGEIPLAKATQKTAPPNLIRYGYRPFDYRYALYDVRLADRPRPDLYALHSDQQIYLLSRLSSTIGHGQAMAVSFEIPDLHNFAFGGRDVLPLYCDREAQNPNIKEGLREMLSTHYQRVVTAEDIAAYCYALLGGQSYTELFWDELAEPAPRVPISKDVELFGKAVSLGQRLLSLHCYGERWADKDSGKVKKLSESEIMNTKAIPHDPAKYPIAYGYDEKNKRIWVGKDKDDAGHIEPVSPAIWNFEISGFKVVQSWLGYRMQKRKGKKSSPLDDLRPKEWSATMNQELLDLVRVIEATLNLEPDLAAILNSIVDSDCFAAADLPESSEKGSTKPTTDSVDYGDGIFSHNGCNGNGVATEVD